RTSAVTRRGLFGLGAASAAGVAVAAGAASRAEGTVGDAGQFTLGAVPVTGAGGTGFSSGVVPFTGAHQAGISTPVQDRMHTAAFDLTTTDRVAVVRLLKDWTAAAARMTAGH